MSRISLLALMVAFVVGTVLMLATPSMALHKNYDGQLACGACHTMHNSQGGGANELGGASGGSIRLLRASVTSDATIHNLCLQCHADDGAQAGIKFDGHETPKVHFANKGGQGPTGSFGGNFSLIGAGGDFSADLTASGSGWVDNTTVSLGRAHSLGELAVTPPGGDVEIATFTCTNCHDPHGAYQASTANAAEFRNLRPIATGSGDNSNVTVIAIGYIGMGDGVDWTAEGSDGAAYWPVYKPATDELGDCNVDNSGTANCYSTGVANDVDEVVGMSRWCAQCHDNWHEDIDTGNENAGTGDWQRHPVDNRIADGDSDSGSGVNMIDTSNYPANGQAGSDFGLPVAKNTGASNFTAQLDGENSQSRVFCLSCHFAHGGPYYDNLRWDYTSAVGPGSQTGKSVASNVGCQMCHNR